MTLQFKEPKLGLFLFFCGNRKENIKKKYVEFLDQPKQKNKKKPQKKLGRRSSN